MTLSKNDHTVRYKDSMQISDSASLQLPNVLKIIVMNKVRFTMFTPYCPDEHCHSMIHVINTFNITVH